MIRTKAKSTVVMALLCAVVVISGIARTEAANAMSQEQARETMSTMVFDSAVSRDLGISKAQQQVREREHIILHMGVALSIFWALVMFIFLVVPRAPETTPEKIELALIPVFGAGLWLMAPGLPNKLGVGNLLLGASALLLFQSLIRDLWLLAREKRAAQLSPLRKARCMCIESTVGATGIVVAIVLLGSGIDRSVVMNDWIWSPLVMVILGIGFLIKDYVFEWGPLRVRRDRDHVNIVFTWKN